VGRGRAEGHIPLRRLLDRRATEALLAAAAAGSGDVAALIEVDGSVFALGSGSVDPSAPTLRRALARSAVGTNRVVDGGTLVAIGAHDLTLGGLLVGGRVGRVAVDLVRQGLTAMLEQAMDLRVLGEETLERYREINLLYRVGETIGASLDASSIPGLLLSEASQAIRSDAGAVLIGPDRAVHATLGRGVDVEALVATSGTLVDDVLAEGRPMIRVAPTGPSGLGATLGVPIRARDERIGVVLLARRSRRPDFTAADEKMSLAVASEAGVAYDRARLHAQEVVRQRMDEELAVGRRMQLSMLPAATPTAPGWEFAAVYEAAREVGGDFYDFLATPGTPGSLDVVVGDVTGKGVPAALLMTFTRAVLRASATVAASPAEILRRSNHHIIHDGRAGLFVTALYARLDLATGDLDFASGGHDPPLWVRGAARRTRLLTSRSSILGAFASIDLEDRRVHLDEGDVLVLYTDGVTEARDARQRLFGERRLRSVVAAHATGSATRIADALMGELSRFANDTPRADDLTLVVVKRTAP
jgi:sigma-B regulation protein RsbU (phosphoserine phosphatase)